jgi:hypothetical protein
MKTISFRVSDITYEKLKNEAEKKGFSISDVARENLNLSLEMSQQNEIADILKSIQVKQKEDFDFVKQQLSYQSAFRNDVRTSLKITQAPQQK